MKNKKPRLLTGDRPTGRLHVGHYAGSIANRLKLQEEGKYESFVFIADTQALTDNFDNPSKVKESVKELMIDYLACGLDPNKTTLFIQSGIPELTELTMYYMNLVTVARLERNPTVKNEIKDKAFGKSIPAGFLCYPVSQAADITAFDADIVPCGEDQLPMIEQTREIVRTFNRIYGETLVEPKELLADSKQARRVPGTDGGEKMGKSLGNCIYLSDDDETIRKKVMGMYTDPNHIKISDPGDTENNPVFKYLEIFSPDQEKVAEMEEHYRRGGLGDVVVKKYLVEVMQNLIRPIREKRERLEKNLDYVYQVFEEGTKKAREIAKQTLARVREAIGLEYFKR